MSAQENDRCFDDVAIEYARHAYHVELARTSFNAKRDQLLESLGNRVVRSLAGRTHRPLIERTLLGPKVYSTYLEGRYLAERARRHPREDRKADDGYWIGFASDEKLGAREPQLAFRSHLFFRMVKDTHRKLEPLLAEFAAKVGGLNGYEAKGWAYVTMPAVPVQEFSLARVEAMIDGLPARFDDLDGQLAAAYRRLWP